MRRPLVKICGITDEKMLKLIEAAGADFVGFVYYFNSPRHVEIMRASLLSKLLKGGCKSVLLLVDPEDEVLDVVYKHNNFDYIQLHGDETKRTVSKIKSYLDRPIIKAFRVGSSADIEAAKKYQDVADWLLFDAKSPDGQMGGTGHAFDWSLLKGHTFEKPWMLSGGLDASNVTQALSELAPDAVDISSGVESSHGVKDVEKIKAFIDTVHSE